LQDAQGQTGALVVLEDVTARITLEEQLQQREKLSSIGLLAAVAPKTTMRTNPSLW